MFKKILRLEVLTTLGLALIAGQMLESFASDAYTSGRLISSTPYDHKLAVAGVFGATAPGAQGSDSMENLFRKARSFRYAKDRGDAWQTPEETEVRRAGDCEDMAVWLYERLLHSGYEDVRLVIGKYRSLDRSNHVWVICSDGSGTYLLDPAMQKKIWKTNLFSGGLYKPLYSYGGNARYRHSS